MKEKKICDRNVILREVTMKCGRFFVFMRHNSAGIWGFRYELTRSISTLKIMASTGVSVRIFFTLNRCISWDPQTPSPI
jgi:hypothetical protein